MTWNGIRGTLQWLVVLLMLTIIAAGGMVVRFWTIKDHFIKNSAATALAEFFPTCDVSFDSVVFFQNSSIELTNLTIAAKSSGILLAEFPRVMLQFDADALESARTIVVTSLQLDSPTVYILQNGDGSSTWSDFQLGQPRQKYSPKIQLHNGKVRYGIQQSFGTPIHELAISGIEFEAVPVAMHKFQLIGVALAESVGRIDVQGNVDATTGQWNLAGTVTAIRFDSPLLNRTGHFVPEVGEKLAELQQTSPLGSGQIKLAGDLSTERITQDLFRADLDLHFDVSQANAEADLDYHITSQLANGFISDVLLPVPLYNVSAKLEVTPDRIVIDHFQGTNNNSSLAVHGWAYRVENDWAKNFSVQAQALQIDERIESVLPDDLRKVYEMIRPSGTFDLDFDVAREINSDWTGTLRKFTARNCRVVHEYFQYPIEGIHGAVIHRDGAFHYDMIGSASGQEITLTGYCGDSTGDGTSDLLIRVANLPIDDRFRNALQTKDQAGTRSAIEALRLTGRVDLNARFRRTPDSEERFKMTLNATVRDASANFVGFPYQLEGLSGTISFDAFQENVWKFDNLQAHHGHASFVNGRGVVDVSISPPAMALEFACVQIPIDSELEKASLVSAPHLSPIWTDFELDGTVDVDRVTIGWRSGQPTEVTLRRIHWKDGHIKPAALPYRWDDVVGTLEWDGSRLKIHSLNGWHDGTFLHIDGTKPDKVAFIEVPSSSPVAWHVHFGDLRLVKLKVDNDLLKALPVDLAASIAGLDLRGPTDLQFNADLKGWNSNANVVTADWEVFAQLSQNSLFAGIPLTNVTGQARMLKGNWDGRNLFMEGYFELSEATAQGLTFKKVRSPLLITQDRVIVGRVPLEQTEWAHSNTNPFRDAPLRSEIYSGQAGLDAEVLFATRPELTAYRGELTIKDVELGQWAADQFQSAQKLSGSINGVLKFQGMGPSTSDVTGQGWINISPAAIYELPAFAQVFSLPNFRRVSNNAFEYAYADFTVKRGQFDFSYIALNGEALGLTGRGSVGYAAGGDSLVILDFASRINNQVPFLRNIIQPLGNNWIRVQVTGTVKEPRALIHPSLGPLEDLIKRFGTAMNNGIRPATPN